MERKKKVVDQAGRDEFGRQLAEALEVFQMSISALAKESGVSRRTIERVIRGLNTPYKKNVLKWAGILSANQNEWLKLLGYREAGLEEIGKLVSNHLGLVREGESKSVVSVGLNGILEKIKGQLDKGQPVLMCLNWTTDFTFWGNELAWELRSLIAKGMHLAIFCPFGYSSEQEVAGSYCAEYCNSICAEMYEFKRKVRRNSVEPDDRVRVFWAAIPNQLLVPPVAGGGALIWPVYLRTKLEGREWRQVGNILKCPSVSILLWDNVCEDLSADYFTGFRGKQKIVAGKAWEDYFQVAVQSWDGNGWKEVKENSSWKILE